MAHIHIPLFRDPSRKKKDFSFPVSTCMYISREECDCPPWGHGGSSDAGYSDWLSWGQVPACAWGMVVRCVSSHGCVDTKPMCPLASPPPTPAFLLLDL